MGRTGVGLPGQLPVESIKQQPKGEVEELDPNYRQYKRNSTRGKYLRADKATLSLFRFTKK